MHSYTELLKDSTHKRAVKHCTNQGLCWWGREEEGRPFKGPAPCWEERSGVFWKSLWGEKQINAQGELQKASISCLCGGKWIQTHPRVYSKETPPLQFPFCLLLLSCISSLQLTFMCCFSTLSPFLSLCTFRSNSQFYLCAYLFFWTKVLPYCLKLTHSFPLMVIPHLTVGRWNTEASPIFLICRQKSSFQW